MTDSPKPSDSGKARDSGAATPASQSTPPPDQSGSSEQDLATLARMFLNNLQIAAAEQQLDGGSGLADMNNLKLRIARSLTGDDSGGENQLAQRDVARQLSLSRPDSVTVAFPPCSDVMLSLAGVPLTAGKDDVHEFFDDYFEFSRHSILGRTNRDDYLPLPPADLVAALDPDQMRCAISHRIGLWPHSVEGVGDGDTSDNPVANIPWPPFWCFPPSCVTLRGRRNTAPLTEASKPIRRLFVGDVLWLFYMDRMGIFRILGAILDDYAYTGRLPISNGSLDPGVRDDIVALIAETMTRQMETGNASTLRRRVSTYMRTLGWTLPEGRSLGLNSVVHTGFNREFHEFLRLALKYYRDKRLATAIRGIESSDTTAATLKAMADRIAELKRGFETFQYGRNYSNTLSGIVWAVAGMSLIRELAPTLGIPSPGFSDPYEYIPAAYELLVGGRAAPTTRAVSRVNRYITHRDCANNGRRILMDIEGLDNTVPNFADSGGDLETWLSIVESDIEGYRGAYLALTNVDLGVKTVAVTNSDQPPVVIEQQV